MTTEHSHYDIFISYARKDNAPIPEGHPVGWVTALRDHILADHRRFSTEPLGIFFDTDDIGDMDDWWHRILGALRSSRILLVCLSPNYFASKYCRKEWDEYRARQVHLLIGSDTVAGVYFVELPNTDEKENARWLEELSRGNYTDIRPWFPEGPAALEREDVRLRMAGLGSSLWERIQRSRRAQNPPGNMRRLTPFFVGRTEELRRLHANVGAGAVGLITAVHGLGGQGKTELAVAYAHGYADKYRAGLWLLQAEGKSELLPLIGELAFDPELNYSPTDAEKANPALLGRAVLAELKRRALAIREADNHAGASALILLDNVSDPTLLSGSQLATLPTADWLRVVATTRIGPDRLANAARSLALLPVDSLEEADALALMREHQPLRDAHGKIVTDPAQGHPSFASAQDEAAALEIVRALGGFTLAVEQVAIFLGLHPESSPADYLAALRANGLPSTDDIPADATSSDQMLHQQKQLAPILAATIESLAPPSRTALQFAALLPPDTVPWPWLQALTAARHPELAETGQHNPAPWQSVRRRLTGLRLLTPGADEEIARIHRLVAAHVSRNADASAQRDLDAHLTARARAIYRSSAAPAVWELDALTAALPHALAAAGSDAAHPLASYRDMANAAVFLSDRVKTYRSLPAAAALLESAHSLLAPLATSDPGNAGWQRDLSVSHNRLGDLAVAQGDLPGALQHFTESLTIRERLAASDRDNAQWQRDLSVSHNWLGNVAVAQGDLMAAHRHYTDYLAIAERLAASDPGNAQWQRDLSVSHNKLGDLAVTQGDLTAALRHFNESLRIMEPLAASDPANADWQRDLSISHNRLGDLTVAQGDLSGALQHFAEDLAIAERLAASDPGNAGWQRDLSISHDRLGDMAKAQGDLPDALQRFTACLIIRERLAASDPGNAGWQRDLSVSHNKLGDMAVAQGDLTGALQHFTESLAIAERLAASDPGNAEWQRDLSISHNKLGNIAVAQGDLPGALRHFTGDLAIAERLATTDPGNAEWQRDLSISHNKLGDLAVAQGDLTEALKHFTEGLAITERLAASDPGNAQWQRDLWVSYWRLADFAEKQGGNDALLYWRKAHDTLAAMKSRGLHLSPQDEQFLLRLRAKVAGRAIGRDA